MQVTEVIAIETNWTDKRAVMANNFFCLSMISTSMFWTYFTSVHAEDARQKEKKHPASK